MQLTYMNIRVEKERNLLDKIDRSQQKFCRSMLFLIDTLYNTIVYDVSKLL